MLYDKLKEGISNSIENILSYNGVVFRIINKEGKSEYIDMDECDCETCIKADNFDDYMVIYVLQRMIEEDKIKFVGDCSNDIDYIKKLLNIE